MHINEYNNTADGAITVWVDSKGLTQFHVWCMVSDNCVKCCHCSVIFWTGRNYETEEEARRKHIFASNLKRIEMHNFLHSKGLKSFRLGITPFADMVSLVWLVNGNRTEIAKKYVW